MKISKLSIFQDLRPFLSRMDVLESEGSFCLPQIGARPLLRQPWATPEARNLENHDFGVLGHARGHFWPEFDVGGCAAHNVLKNTWLVETV